MKTPVKAKTTRTAKRELFAELSEGMVALAEARQGKRTACPPSPVAQLRRTGNVGKTPSES
jgi:hypothetical protein